MARILITGASGQLGTDFSNILADEHEIVPLTKDDCDVTDQRALEKKVRDASPDVILHAAAFTAVDKAEREPDMAYAVNALGSRNVARAAKSVDAYLLAVSTDYVFSGSKGRPYHEFDRPHPVNTYGASKLAGEEEVRRHAEQYTIVRTGWLYGSGRCFPKNIARLAREKTLKNEPLLVVQDQSGAPTSTRALTTALEDLIRNPFPGIVHATCQGVASWYEFAHEVVTALEIPCDIKPCRTDDVPRPAPRPPYSVLDNMVRRLENREPLPEWRGELRSWLAENRAAVLDNVAR